MDISEALKFHGYGYGYMLNIHEYSWIFMDIIYRENPLA